MRVIAECIFEAETGEADVPTVLVKCSGEFNSNDRLPPGVDAIEWAAADGYMELIDKPTFDDLYGEAPAAWDKLAEDGEMPDLDWECVEVDWDTAEDCT